ncbi:hypothetical protein L6164_008047 [Bauhinia variegata]|uniref:Uncharacterized protein n=1 Tax=Bauhinia variegata TaxID=167791 RepID=A0ACB9PEN6_BAUVA|nr:hypothetical protein L6164_008047 [Bauhinia variegata]
MPVVTDASTVAEHIKWRRPRNQFSHAIAETDPSPQIPSIIQSTRCKSTISSLLLSTLSNNSTNETMPGNVNGGGHNHKKKNNFSAASFRGLGCTAGASQQVSVPALIRTSADWQGKKARKKKHKRSNANGSKTVQGVLDGSNSGSANFVDFQDVWCGPGIGFSADAAASVDCVVARKNASNRGKIDAEKISHRERERPTYLGRRTVNPEPISFMDSDPDIFDMRHGSDSWGTARFYRHTQPDVFPEIVMLQGSLLMGGRLDSHDRFRDWRLDVDNMTYEQLLELGERIGHVNTGLKEDEIGSNIRKSKPPIQTDTSTPQASQVDKKCSICQEEYEADDELGKLNCGHSYHVQCIRQWLAQKNFCPVCKAEVVFRQRVPQS